MFATIIAYILAGVAIFLLSQTVALMIYLGLNDGDPKQNNNIYDLIGNKLLR